MLLAAPPQSAVRRLATAQAISFAGGTSAFVALSASLYARTGSALWPAAVAAASFVLPGLCGPFLGGLADRFDRRRLMVGSDLLGAACFLALAVPAASPGAMVGVKALAGLAAVPFAPAAAATLPRLVAGEALPRANATLSSWGTAGTLVGPLIGGTLTALAGAPVVFVFNAATFLVSASLVAHLGRGADFRPAPPQAGRDRGLMAGLRLLATDPVLRGLSAGSALLLLGMGTTTPAEVVRAEEMGLGAGGYGLMVAVWASGALVGARLAGALMDRHGARPLLVFGSALVAAGLLLVAVTPWLAPLLLGLAAGGVAEGLAEVVNVVVIQRRSPEPVIGRALAARWTVEQIAYSLPLFAVGPLIDSTGARPAYVAGATACALAAVVFAAMRFPRRARPRRRRCPDGLPRSPVSGGAPGRSSPW
jgi:MFS family permease